MTNQCIKRFRITATFKLKTYLWVIILKHKSLLQVHSPKQSEEKNGQT